MRAPKLFQAILGQGQKNTATVHFKIDGMHCASCVARVEQAIRQLPGISSVTVHLPSGMASITHDSGKIPPEQIRQAVTAAGYNPIISSGEEP